MAAQLLMAGAIVGAVLIAILFVLNVFFGL
jgi:hypothetical protein